MTIAFATSEQLPDLAPDDRLAAAEIERRGGRVVPAIWTQAQEWTRFDLVVLRSCWDYHRHSERFRSWIAELDAAGARLMNPAPVVRWNLDKRYLLELAAAGVDVIATDTPEPGARLSRILHARGWRRAVLKPRVSADGHRTMMVHAATADAQQGELDELLAGPGAIVQEYLEEIGRSGEISLIFLGGEFSHCVRKRPAPGEFRVQSRYGGSAEPCAADAMLIDQARAVLRAGPPGWTYARVDGCVVAGRLKLMELELIEPSLFFDCDESAAACFAELVLRAAG